MKKMIHVIEGTTMNTEMEGGDVVVTFVADIVDDWVELDAEGMHDLIQQCSLDGVSKLPLEQIRSMMEKGANTFVIEHVGDQAMMHFVAGDNVEVTGTLQQQILH